MVINHIKRNWWINKEFLWIYPFLHQTQVGLTRFCSKTVYKFTKYTFFWSVWISIFTWNLILTINSINTVKHFFIQNKGQCTAVFCDLLKTISVALTRFCKRTLHIYMKWFPWNVVISLQKWNASLSVGFWGKCYFWTF